MRKKYNYENVEQDIQGASVSSSNKLTYLLIGGGIGALVALLFAPKAGQELRGDIADATRKGYDKTLETAQQLKEQSGTYYQQIKEQAGDAYTAATDKLKGAKSQLNSDGEKNSDLVLNSANNLNDQGTSSTQFSDFGNDAQKNQSQSY